MGKYQTLKSDSRKKILQRFLLTEKKMSRPDVTCLEIGPMVGFSDFQGGTEAEY